MSSSEGRIDRLERRVELLLAKVEAQAVEIAELKTENTTLRADNATLRADNATLRADNADLRRRLGENSSNSNKPPSSDPPGHRDDRPKPTPSGRAPGGQPGHKGNRRALLPASKVTRSSECYPPECRRCGTELPRQPDPDPLRHQVIDVPKIEPDVHEFRQHRVTCSCGAITCGALPPGTPAGLFGPRLLTLTAVLTGAMHVSRRKVQLLLTDLLGIEVSLGCISESEAIVSDAIAAAVDEARVHALAERVKHVDATTWYQAGAYRSLWVLATKAVTVFYVAANGTEAALRKWLSEVRGVLVTDRGSQFGFWAMDRRQICWAHLVRKFAAYETRGGDAGRVGALLLLWTGMVLHYWHEVRAGTLTRAKFRTTVAPLRAAIERVLDQGTRASGIAGSCVDILSHREALWTFIDELGVDPTNNHAERELRGFVLWRKLTFGSRSDRGTRFAANLKSVVHTCRKQRRHVFDYLTRAIRASLRNRHAPSLLAAA